MATNDSYVLTAEKNGIKVKSTIYGVITPERVANARKELSYRLEQLQPIPKLSEMEEYRQSRRRQQEEDEEYEDDYEDYDE